jgi:CRP/FNR family cyclic AMP-dependent transcriptional regulator
VTLAIDGGRRRAHDRDPPHETRYDMKRPAAIDQLRQVPLFSTCTKAELEMILGATTQLTFTAGDILATEGARGHEFMVIDDGRARVEIGGQLISELGPGDFFGEIALLDGGPRTATVIAETDFVAEIISERDFDGLVARSPALDRKILVGLARRLRQADVRMTS